MFSEKTHDLMRKLQLIFAASAGAIGIVSAAVDLGRIGVIIAAILSAAGYFVGHLAENDSAAYFDTKTIMTKVMPDEEVER